jgi:hypothetical protein
LKESKRSQDQSVLQEEIKEIKTLRMLNSSLLKQAIEDAKNVRATALINAKEAMQEAFEENFGWSLMEFPLLLGKDDANPLMLMLRSEFKGSLDDMMSIIKYEKMLNVIRDGFALWQRSRLADDMKFNAAGFELPIKVMHIAQTGRVDDIPDLYIPLRIGFKVKNAMPDTPVAKQVLADILKKAKFSLCGNGVVEGEELKSIEFDEFFYIDPAGAFCRV